MSRAMFTFASIVSSLGVASLGCGTTCDEIGASRAAFDDHAAASAGPHAELRVPLALLNERIASRLARARSRGADDAPPLSFAPLATLGLDVDLRFAWSALRLVPSSGGRVGVEVEVGIRAGGAALGTLSLATDVVPRVDPAARVVAVDVSAADLRDVSPRLAPGAKASLGAWLSERLPAAVGATMSRALFGELAEHGLRWVVEEGFPLVRDHVLAPLDVGTTLSVALPELPIRALSVATVAGREPALVAGITTTVPGADRLTPAARRPEEGVAGQVTARLSGGLVAALANRAMARGDLASRFDGEGRPDPEGPFSARVAWRGGERPLAIHLWRLEGACTYARVGGDVRASLSADAVNIDVVDGAYEVLRGPASVEAVAWLANVWKGPVETSVAVAREHALTLAGEVFTLRVAALSLSDDVLRVAATIAPEEERAASVTASSGRSSTRCSGRDRAASDTGSACPTSR